MKTDNKDKISEDDAKTIDEAVEAAKKVQGDEKAAKDALETASKELSEKIMPIGAKMYEEASKETSDESEKSKDESTEDKKSSKKKKGKDEPVEGEVIDEK